MLLISVRILTNRLGRTVITVAGLGVLFFLCVAQVGMLVGWCNTTTAIIRNCPVDIWVMAEQTPAFDYGTPIPRQRVFQARGVPGVQHAEGMFMGWNFWQRPDGRRINVEMVGLDDSCLGGPWAMQEGDPSLVHLPEALIIDELFRETLGIHSTGEEVEIFGRRGVVRGFSKEVRTFTASPFVFTSIDSAIRYDRRYRENEITYALVKCEPGVNPETVRERLRAELPYVDILTSREFSIKTMKYWMLETGVGITVVLTAMLGFAVSIVVTSQTMFAITGEHIGDYATLSALGFLPSQLLKIVLTQTLALQGGGILLGTMAFQVASNASSRTPVPLEMTPAILLGLISFSLLTGLVGTYASVRTVLQISPATVFRGE